MTEAFGLRRMLGNLGAATIARIGAALLSMVLFWRLSHVLSTAELGGFALLMSLYALLQGLPLLGLHVPLTREVATRPDDLARRLCHHRWFAMPVAVALGLALAAYGHWTIEPPLHPALFAVAAAMLPTAATQVAESALIGQERVGIVALVSVVEGGWRLVASLAAVAAGAGLTGVAVAFLVGRCLAWAIYRWRAGLPVSRAAMRPSAAQWRGLWRQVPVYLGIVAVAAFSTRVDTLALSRLLGLDAVAHYAVAAKLYEAALMLPTLAALVVLPSLARQFNADRPAFVANVPRVVRAILLWGMPIALIGAGAMPWLIGVAFPPAFADAVPMAQVLLLAALLAALDMILASWMQAARAQTADLMSLSMALLVMVATVLLLAPWLGALGAAVAMLAQMAARVLVRAVWARRVLGVHGLGAVFGKAALAAAIASGAWAACVRWQPAAAVPATLLAYVVVLAGLGLLRPAQIWTTLRGAPSPWTR